MNPLNTLEAMSDSLLNWGTNDPLPAIVPISCGRMKLYLQQGTLRHICWDDSMVLLMIYAALRNENWETIEPNISDQVVEIGKSGFNITYWAHYKKSNIDFSASFSIHGNEQGNLVFTMEGEAHSTFLKNRIGFCILHPIDSCPGKQVRLFHPDGSTSNSIFPEFISPHQPFKNLSGMHWMPSDDLEAVLQFSGDVFETEDQRNWTDASFKTYCTPLELPFPVTISPGTKVKQEVKLSIIEKKKSTHGKTEHKIRILIHRENSRPISNLGISASDYPLSDSDIALLKPLELDHYQVSLKLNSEDWLDAFRTKNQEAKKLGIPLKIALFFGNEPEQEAHSFIKVCFDLFPQVEELLIFQEGTKATPQKLFELVEPLLREGLHNSKIGAGTQAYFAEFNRNQPFPGKADFLTFSINPQVHATDHTSIIENLIALPHTVRTVRHSEKLRPVHISALNLRPQFNPDATSNIKITQDQMPFRFDPRQMSLFTAGWTLGAFKYLAESGVSSITCFQTNGEGGILNGSEHVPWSGSFNSIPGMVYPVFFIFLELLKRKNSHVLYSSSSQPFKVNSLVLKESGNITSIIANHSDQSFCLEIVGFEKPAMVKRLNAHTIRNLLMNPGNWNKPTLNETIDDLSQITIEPCEILILHSQS